MNFFQVLMPALMGMLFANATPSADAGPKTIQMGTNSALNIVDDFVINLKVNDSFSTNITGTIEDAFAVLAKYDPAQAQAINDSIIDPAARNSSTSLAPFSSLTSLSADDDCCTRASYTCDTHTDASCIHIAQGIGYLKTVKGSAVQKYRGCSRVSCSYNSGIYWCNNATTELGLDNFTIIANAAQQVMDDCTFEQADHICTGSFNGVQWYSGDWAVVVSGEEKC